MTNPAQARKRKAATGPHAIRGASLPRVVEAGEQPANDPPIERAKLDPMLYLEFVRKIATRIARHVPSHVCIDDLVSAGMVGLIDAMDRYDPARVDRFETFAEFRVKGAMLDELRRDDLMARNARLTSKRITRTIQQLTSSLGRPPCESEIADTLRMTAVEYRRLLDRVGGVHMVSLEELGCDVGSPCIGPDELTHRRELEAHLERAFAALPERQRQVLDMYYRRDMTLKAIGRTVGVTESRVCQIVNEATNRLRMALKNDVSRE